MAPPRTPMSPMLGLLRRDEAYPVPWGLRVTRAPDIHQLTNLGRHPLDDVSITVLVDRVPAAGWMPGAAVTLRPGDSVEVRAPRAVGAQTVVVCWRRPGGAPYLWSTPV